MVGRWAVLQVLVRIEWPSDNIKRMITLTVIIKPPSDEFKKGSFFDFGLFLLFDQNLTAFYKYSYHLKFFLPVFEWSLCIKIDALSSL